MSVQLPLCRTLCTLHLQRVLRLTSSQEYDRVFS